MEITKKDGISLIILVITIIVMIILTGAIVASLSSNNPILQATKVVFLNDVKNFQTELELYKSIQFSEKRGRYNPISLQADNVSLTYNGDVDTSKTINDLIPSLEKAIKYDGLFIVVNGELVYQGLDTNMQTWVNELEMQVVVPGAPIVTIIPPINTIVSQGTDIVYTIKFSSNVALTTIDLTGKVEVLDNSGVTLTSQPVITIGTISGTSDDSIRQVDVTIATNTLTVGIYKLKIKSGTVTNVDNISNTFDTISLTGFNINTTPPTNPIMSANPTLVTGGDVSITIIYSTDTVTKEYSFDGIFWSLYTIPVVVSTNNTTVYARGKDSVQNICGVATITVANIDKDVPTVTYGTNGGTNEIEVSTTVTASDIGSGINVNSLQYIWDTQDTVAPSSGWTTFTNGTNITKTGDGTYYLWIKALDNVGNLVIEKSNLFTIGDIVTIVGTVQTVNKTFTGATTGFSYDNPVIPAGFVAVNTTDVNWSNLSIYYDKGLVIQDVSGNQFVWVPVDGTDVTYSKWCTTGISYESTSEDTTPVGFSIANIITTYKGFYIARYESMFDYNGGNLRAASKKSTNKTISSWTRDSAYTGYLFNNIDYNDAKVYSENMDTSYGYDTTKVGTNLITGTEWDTVMKWIQNSGKSVTDSRTWGNHSDSISPADVAGYRNLQISGYSNNWKTKNIYDLAGNTWEWTNEVCDIYYSIRGGMFGGNGVDYCAASRFISSAIPGSNDAYYSFRMALYVL